MIFGKDDLLFRGARGNTLATRSQLAVRIDGASKGVNLLSDISDASYAYEATNLMLGKDGFWTKRWGTKTYGTSGLFTADLDGFTEYRKSTGGRELLVVADGKCWRVDPDAGTKTEITGGTFTSGYPCDFAQIEGRLYIVNGHDYLSYYDGSTIHTYTSLSAPTWAGTPITRGGGLSTGTFTYYYKVTAVNEVGETIASSEASIAVNKERDDWDFTANEYVTLDWGDVSGALKYVIYFSDVSGYEVKLGEVTSSTYSDRNVDVPNPYIGAPTASTASGAKFSSIAIIGNRIWGTNDSDNPQRAYWSGTGVNLGNFSPAFDGGWIDLDLGSRVQTQKIIDFNRNPHIVCKTDDGRGSIWEIAFVTAEIAGQSITVPQATKLIAQMGSGSPRSVIHVENDIFFFNKFGVFTLGMEPNLFNVLRTKEKSTLIQPFIDQLYEPDVSNSCSYYYNGLVFFSVPTEDGGNNRIFLYDLMREAWVAYWTIGVSQFGEFTDSVGKTHFLGACENKIIEFSENYRDDDGTVFSWKLKTPRVAIDKNWTKFGFFTKVFVRVQGATGSSQYEVHGTSLEGLSVTLGSGTIEREASCSGLGWDVLGSALLGDTEGETTTYQLNSLIRFLEVDTLLRDVQWEISGTTVDSKLTVTGLLAEGRPLEVSTPESWRI